MKVKFKGIIRGVYSELQREFPSEPAVLVYEGDTLEDVVVGLVLSEWIYALYVNGKRIANPERYLKRKGIWNQCIRTA
jgi:hypothetical protein